MYYWKTMPVEERIAVRIKPNGECREWTGGMNGARKPEQRRPVMKRGYVSRIVWELAHGPIPDGQEVCHTCDNPLCVRTSHLFLGTHKDNTADMMNKKRHKVPRGIDTVQAKFTEMQVLEIRARYEAGGITGRALAATYNVSHGAIFGILKRSNWKHLL